MTAAFILFRGVQNFELYLLKNRLEVSNMAAIRKLVAGNCGISFLYQAVAEKYDIISKYFETWRGNI